MAGRPRSSDRFVATTLSLPQSTEARLQRLLDAQRRPDAARIYARDLLLGAIAAEEARLRLPPLAHTPLPPPAPLVPGSTADHARAPVAPVPPVPPPAAPPEAPRVPGEGPWLPPPGAVETYFHPPAGTTPDEVFDRLLPKAHS